MPHTGADPPSLSAAFQYIKFGANWHNRRQNKKQQNRYRRYSSRNW